MTVSPSRPSSGGATDPVLDRLIEELTDRLQAGAPIDLEGLVACHPLQADAIRQLLPALEVLAGLGRSAAQGPPAGPGAVAELGILGDFRIIREVGRGGMGVVYEAEQVSLSRRVALKVLPFAAALDPRQLQRFKVEAMAAAQLHRTGIVPIYSVGIERGVHYYAMQFIDGRSLAEVIAELRRLRKPGNTPEAETESEPSTSEPAPTPLPEPWSSRPSIADRAFFESAARLGIQAAEALEYAHSLGVVHRDIKPANLMIDARGELWVADFGLARLGDDAGLTLSGDVLGTLRYMGPEQALGRPGLVGPRADIYALGATLYELLTLRPAVAGRDRQELMRRIAFEEPAPPRRIEPAIPRELETIVLKALAKEPEGRYATAQELADDLRRFLEHRPIRARRPTLLERATKWSRRHAAWLAAGALTLALAVTGLAVGYFRVSREQSRTRAALERAEDRTRLARRAVDEMYSRFARDWLARQAKLEPVQREFLEEALRFYEVFARERGADSEARLQAVRAYQNVGDIRQKLGMLREAEVAYRDALKLLDAHDARSREESDGRRDLEAQIQNNLGAMLVEAGRIDDALPAFGRAVALHEELADDHPDRPTYRALAVSESNNLAIVQFRNGKAAEAEQTFRRAIANGETLMAAAPTPKAAATVDDVRLKVAGSCSNLGLMLKDLRRYSEAEGPCRRAVALSAEARAQSPGDLELRFRHAWSLSTLSLLLGEMNRPDEAVATVRQALAIEKGLIAEAPTVIRYRELRANDALNLAEKIKGASQTLPEAIASYQTSIDLLESLASDSPDAREIRDHLGLALERLARLLTSDTPVQVRDPARAAPLARRLVQLRPHDWQARVILGMTLYRVGDWDTAIRALEEALALKKKDDAMTLFFLAMARQRRGQEQEAREAYRGAVRRMEAMNVKDEGVNAARAEAAALLGLPEGSPENR